MKYKVELKNIYNDSVREIDVDSISPQEAHKKVLISECNSKEEDIVKISTEKGVVVYLDSKGFF